MVLSHHLKPGRECRPRWQQRAPLNGPGARIISHKGEPQGLPARNREGIEPEWLPAVVQVIEQTEMMAVHIDNLGRIAAVDQREDHRASLSDRKQWSTRPRRDCPWALWDHPFVRKVDVHPDSLLEAHAKR